MGDEYGYLKENVLTMSENNDLMAIPIYFYTSSEQEETAPG